MISIKSKKEIETIKEGGKILAEVMQKLEKMVKPGVTTKELDKVAEGLVLRSGAKCSFKGYKGYPACLCTSINEGVVHALPSESQLKDGDIISLDLGILYKKFHTDMALTLAVGKVSPESVRLIRVTKKALKRGIKKTRPGNTLGDIGNTIQRAIESQGFKVIQGLCGHGIGRELHEDPQILNFGKRHKGEEIKEGMVFCLEPMVAIGDYNIKKSADGYGLETADGSLSAHFEHTIAVTKTGCQILTSLE